MTDNKVMSLGGNNSREGGFFQVKSLEVVVIDNRSYHKVTLSGYMDNSIVLVVPNASDLRLGYVYEFDVYRPRYVSHEALEHFGLLP